MNYELAVRMKNALRVFDLLTMKVETFSVSYWSPMIWTKSRKCLSTRLKTTNHLCRASNLYCSFSAKNLNAIRHFPNITCPTASFCLLPGLVYGVTLHQEFITHDFTPRWEYWQWAENNPSSSFRICTVTAQKGNCWSLSSGCCGSVARVKLFGQVYVHTFMHLY